MIGSKFNGYRLYYESEAGIYQETLPRTTEDEEFVQHLMLARFRTKSKDVLMVWLMVGVAAFILVFGIGSTVL